MKFIFTAFCFLLFSLARAQDFTYTWAKLMGSPSNSDAGRSIALDGSGNVYTTGNFSGTADFNPDPATTFNLTASGAPDAFISKLDATGNFIWARKIGGVETQALSIALDASGNVYTTGYFRGTADFNPDPAVSYNLTASGYYDIYVSKLDASGNFVWAYRFGGTTVGDEGHGITTDAGGNIYVTGLFSGTVDFNPDPAVTTNLVSSGIDVFVLKLDGAGNYIWARRMGGASTDEGNAITVDASGNVYTSGYFNSATADFNPDPAVTNNITSAGNFDIFVSKLDASGNYVWAKGMGGIESDEGSSIAVDASGNVYTAGSFRGTADFNPDPAVATNFTATSNDLFISKLDASGNYVWAKAIGGSGIDRANAVKVDASAVYITGSFESTVDFNPDPAVTSSITSAGSLDIFIARFDASGNYVVARQMGGISADEAYGMAVDGSQNIHLTGTSGTADFNPDPAVATTVTSSGFNDIFVVKLGQTPAPNQAPVITASAGNTAYTEGTPVVIDAAITGTDGNDVNLASANVSITAGLQSGQDVLMFTNQNGITGSYNSTTGVLTLTGAASIANYQIALRSIRYNNTSLDPNTADRTISFVASDGTDISNTATKLVTITAVNNASQITSSAGNTTYVSGTPVNIDAALNVSDVDNVTLNSATISITSGFQTSQDVLQFTVQNGITGAYNAITGILTLSGSATVANYQNALRSVKYFNSSSTPNTANRIISFNVNDGAANSNSATKTVVISNPLPVTLTHFAVTNNSNCNALLKWTTASEYNSKHFEVQHSTDGLRFLTVATISANGNSTTQKQYEYSTPFYNGQNYFRLLMVDHDGSSKLSPTVSMTANCKLPVRIYPNPIINKIDIYGLSGSTQLQVTDHTGRLVVLTHTNRSSETIYLSSLPAGVYLLQVVQNNKVIQNVKLLKE